MIINKRLGQTIGYLIMYSGVLVSLIYGTFRVWEHYNSPSMSDGDVRSAVVIGMTSAEVEDVLGTQYDESDGSWIYKNRPPEDNPEASTRIFVVFEDGKVSKLFFATPRHHSSSRSE